MKKRVCFFILLFVLMLGISCAPKKKIIVYEELSPLQIGDSLWKQGNFQQACVKYELAFYRGEVPQAKQIFYIKRIIRCSLDRGNLGKALLFLKKWKSVDLTCERKWDYQQLYLEYLKTKQDWVSYKSYLNTILTGEFPFALKKNAMLLIEEWYLQRLELEEARTLFKEIYPQFTRKQKEEILKELLNIIEKQKDLISRIQISSLTPTSLPDSVILWTKVSSMILSGTISWIDGYRILYRILSTDIQIRDLLEEKLKELEKRFGSPRLEIALLLPFDGAYDEVSYGILRGVEAGVWELEKEGFEIYVNIINTSFKEWKQELLSIGNKKMIVGGPIRLKVWNEILDTNLPDKMYFFAFRSDLPFEGRKGFRFFPSHRDQVYALIKYFKETFDVDTYGIFYPKGSYGRKLGEVFFNMVKEMGGEVRALGWYDPKAPKTWQKRVGEFLDVPHNIFEEKDEDKIKKFKPDIDFQGIFIPDSFENVRIIIPNFFYFNALHLFYLGPTIWGTGQKKLSGLDLRMFDRAYYPSPWRDDPENKQLDLLKKEAWDLSKQGVDFWTCLGYDFFRFAVKLQARLDDKKDIITILNDSSFEWTIAPITWNDKGIASQQMYVLNVVKHQ